MCRQPRPNAPRRDPRSLPFTDRRLATLTDGQPPTGAHPFRPARLGENRSAVVTAVVVRRAMEYGCLDGSCIRFDETSDSTWQAYNPYRPIGGTRRAREPTRGAHALTGEKAATRSASEKASTSKCSAA
jgi:hypothetical protein